MSVPSYFISKLFIVAEVVAYLRAQMNEFIFLLEISGG
jgi:hypothetical protein